MAIQIVAWMASGFYFSIFPIEEIRGEHLTIEPGKLTVDMMDAIASPSSVRPTIEAQFGTNWELDDMGLINRQGFAVWRVEGRVNNQAFIRLLNESGTEVLPELTAEQAARAAKDRLLIQREPTSVGRVESIEPGGEYRGRILPVWKVGFDGEESLTLYIDPWTGEVLARRTDRWRLFDFLWMLHIMDFDERVDFNHPLLQVAAFLGLIIALSGVLFWAMTTPLLHKRRRA